MADDKRNEDNLTPEQRSEIGSKGGEAVSQDSDYMAEIGNEGGKQSHENKQNEE